MDRHENVEKRKVLTMVAEARGNVALPNVAAKIRNAACTTRAKKRVIREIGVTAAIAAVVERVAIGMIDDASAARNVRGVLTMFPAIMVLRVVPMDRRDRATNLLRLLVTEMIVLTVHRGSETSRSGQDHGMICLLVRVMNHHPDFWMSHLLDETIVETWKDPVVITTAHHVVATCPMIITGLLLIETMVRRLPENFIANGLHPPTFEGHHHLRGAVTVLFRMVGTLVLHQAFVIVTVVPVTVVLFALGIETVIASDASRNTTRGNISFE